MKRQIGLFTLCLLFSAGVLQAGEVAAPDSVTAAETSVIGKVKNSIAATADDGYERFRVGGYGEIVANFMDYGLNRFTGTGVGNTKEHRSSISIPRFVLAFDYKFTSKWILGAEIEFESGGTGMATELEPSENNEYETEMEKAGEVALEQFHITRLIHPAFNIRAGHMVVPVGLTNAHHEPINFFGTSRPEGETTIIPSTWHETGVSLFGSFGKGYAVFDYQLMVVAGLNPDGFGRDGWVRDGKQGLFETDKFSSPGYVARLDYRGVPGLRVGASFYYCADATRNADKEYKYTYSQSTSSGTQSVDYKVPVRIYSADAEYKNRYVTARANIIYGNLDNSARVSSTSLSNNSNYHHGSMRSTAESALCYGAEAGVNLSAFFRGKKCPVIYPFARYEYYNSQQSGEGSVVPDPRCQVSKWTAGINWFALPNLVVKADYTTRQVGTQKVFGTSKYNSENEFSIGIAYVGWFFKK